MAHFAPSLGSYLVGVILRRRGKMRRVIPLVDMHVHLLAGLDDGPKTREDAFAMCRIAAEEGVQMACATAHQNQNYPAVTPRRIRLAHPSG